MWLGIALPVFLAAALPVVREDGLGALGFYLLFCPIVMIRTWIAWRTVFRSGVAVDGGRIVVSNPTGSHVFDAKGAVVHQTNGALPWASRTVICETAEPGARAVAAAALGKRWPLGADVEAKFFIAATGAGSIVGEKLAGPDWLRRKHQRRVASHG